MVPAPFPSASSVETAAAEVAPGASPTASPIPEATQARDVIDDGPRQTCEYSGNEQPVIKGNISSSGERIFHTPGSAHYDRTDIEEPKGEAWFCTDDDALSAGWRPASSNASGGPTPAPVGVEPHSINVNLASTAELKMLPGIGEVKSQAIVDYRALNGPFESTEQLLEVKGIGPLTLEKILELITVE